MPFQPALKLVELAAGKMTEVTFGDRPIAVCNVDGALYAIEGTCPHRGAPLGHGALHGTTVVCPFHGWEFDCRDGKYDLNPNLHLATFPVEVREGEIYIDVPEPTEGYDLELDK
jgi:nitrite reductase (NADH) small subunit